MAKITVEDKVKFVKAFQTAKGTAYSGKINNSNKNQDGTWDNQDIDFVYFGYDLEIKDGDHLRFQGNLGIDSYTNKDGVEVKFMKLTAFEAFPLSNQGQAQGNKKFVGRPVVKEAPSYEANPFG